MIIVLVNPNLAVIKKNRYVIYEKRKFIESWKFENTMDAY